MKADVFPYLLIGLAKFFENGRKYPFPDELRYAQNALSGEMLATYPRTSVGLLRLMAQPLRSWWPSDMPTGFDPEGELVYEGEVDTEVYEYLDHLFETGDLP